MEKNIEIENIKKISEPKRSTSTKYPYIVHIRTKSLKLQRKYFATSEEAWRFFNETKAKLGELPQLNQSADDIISYREAQRLAYSLGVSVGTMVDMYIATKVRLYEICRGARQALVWGLSPVNRGHTHGSGKIQSAQSPSELESALCMF